MESKDKAFSHARDLILRLQTELPKNAIRAVRSDNGTEFKNSQFDTFCASLGLKHQFSSPMSLSRMVLLSAKIGLWLKWPGRCSMSIGLLGVTGPKPSTPLAMFQTAFFFVLS